MKIFIPLCVLGTTLITAQTKVRPKLDSLPLLNIPQAQIFTPNTDSLNAHIANLYKMPVAKPKNPEMYSSLKAIVPNSKLHFIPNLIQPVPEKKVAVKDK